MTSDLSLTNFQHQSTQIIEFLQNTFQQTGKQNAVIAVSGGIDSALSLTLLARALPKEKIWPLFLPCGDQEMADAILIAKFNQIPEANWQTIDIKPAVDSVITQQSINQTDAVRIGNIKARVRMIFVYDLAKKLDALVVGTENKSEQHLGYFTRFGDAASDIEPIEHLYKTQVRQLAEFLKIPQQLITKPPSAGLWPDQTDEQELGFSYEAADKILWQLIDEGKTETQIVGDQVTIKKVLTQVQKMAFKQQVPYTIGTNL